MTYYDIYCTNCETVQVTSKDGLTAELQEKIGTALTLLIEAGRGGELCCHNGECMIDSHYVVRKGVEKVEYERLDDADVNIR